MSHSFSACPSGTAQRERQEETITICQGFWFSRASHVSGVMPGEQGDPIHTPHAPTSKSSEVVLPPSMIATPPRSTLTPPPHGHDICVSERPTDAVPMLVVTNQTPRIHHPQSQPAPRCSLPTLLTNLGVIWVCPQLEKLQEIQQRRR